MSIIVNEDYKELLSAFNDENVEYLVIGAFAVAAHGHARYTKDFDVWIHRTEENVARVYRALCEFGAPMDGVREADFLDEDLIFQVGVEPIRIAVLTEVAGLDFESAWAQKVPFHYGGVPTWVLSREHLLASKRAAGRPNDLMDVEALEKIGPL